MKQAVFGLFAAALGAAAPAMAQDYGFSGDFGLGYWHNADGGPGLESNGGIDGKDDRTTLRTRLSFATAIGNGLTGQIDFTSNDYSSADPSLDTDDATSFSRDLALRLRRDFGGFTAGAFLGYGDHNDFGDSDAAMYYTFAGIEAERAMAFGSIFGEVGYLDSTDEYDEGTQRAPYVRAGLVYNLPNDFVMTGSVGYAGGRKYGDDQFSNTILNAEIGLERAISDQLSVYGSYDYNRISYDDAGDDFGDTIGTLYVGVKMTLGGTKTARPLAPFGKWVSYNANEIE
ncbi:autotransporter outer membrane beta-barrel domain-containing protein [Tabrizicola sp.]|uniref:autotransporter outer membrane beta-barrel domain-containing protein n=1 Tax=Tabrizicola sp. TaxID=2005166 RepID=UPI00286B5046|nr:outer membrane beta-barrel protein [Tabrizicola sp.]